MFNRRKLSIISIIVPNSVINLFAAITIFLTSAQPTSITYREIGKFRLEPYGTFGELLLPQSPREIEPTFQLYTRQNPSRPEQLRWNSSRAIMKSKYFQSSRRTKMIIHGFIETVATADWMHKMKDQFLSYKNLNVILIDWSRGNQFPYSQACANVRVVGAMIGIQIQKLCQLRGPSLNQFHLLGMSLGAHVAGFAGKFLKGKLKQITGLDPAGPGYSLSSPRTRLAPSDAGFVDVIHTDARGLGTAEPWGHADIYPNGGVQQPGCDPFNGWIKMIQEGITQETRALTVCNHKRAIDYYIESIKNSTHQSPAIAYQCADKDDFELNNCSEADCGRSRNRCLFFGPRSIEYQKKAERNSAGKLIPKQFYLRLALSNNKN